MTVVFDNQPAGSVVFDAPPGAGGERPAIPGDIPQPVMPTGPQGTALGRVAGAFTEPFQETQFGRIEPIVQAFQTPGSALNAFNDVAVRGIASPVVAVLNALQLAGAGVEGVIDAMAQAAIEGGLDSTQANIAARDLKGMIEITPAFTGGVPLAPATRAGAARRATAGVPEPTPALVQETRGLRAPVPVTRGDITRDVNIQAFEDEALKGLHGPAAQLRIKALRDEQEAGFRANIEQLQQEVTGRPVAAIQEEAGLGAARAVRGVGEAAEAQRTSIRAAYEEARGLDASIEAKLIGDFSQRVRGNLSEQGFDIEVMPKLSRRLQDLDKVASDDVLTGATVNKMELLRKRMVKDEQSTRLSDPAESAAIGSLRRDLDQQMSDLLDEGLIQGNEEAVKAWKNARDLRADFGRRFEDSKVVRKIVDEDLTQEQAINLLFGGSQMGFRNDAGAIAVRMKEILGADSDAFKALKEEAILRLVKNQTGTFSGSKFNTAVTKAVNQNQTLMRTLFTNGEINEIKSLARIARQITEKTPGAVNNSATFIAAQRAKRKVLSKIPFVGDMIETIWQANDNRRAAGRITDNITLQQDIQTLRRNPELLRRALETAVLLPREEIEEQ